MECWVPGFMSVVTLRKPNGYPQKTDKMDKVVFKLRVRVGKVKKIDSDNHPLQKTWHSNGYDCVWVPPNSSIATHQVWSRGGLRVGPQAHQRG